MHDSSHVTHTPKYCPQAYENTQTARRAHSTHGGAPECASAEGAPSLSIAVSVSRELHTALPCLPTCLAGTPLAALVGSRPSAPMRLAVPSRVEAQTRAEPSAGAQGPVLNEEARLAECERWHGRRMQEGARARRRRQRRRWALPVAAAVGVHQEFTKLSSKYTQSSSSTCRATVTVAGWVKCSNAWGLVFYFKEYQVRPLRRARV